MSGASRSHITQVNRQPPSGYNALLIQTLRQQKSGQDEDRTRWMRKLSNSKAMV